jgi:uncharacterized membrane protein YccC
VFLANFLAGLLPARSPLAALVGLLLTIVFVAALGIGGGPGTALPSALGFLLGGMLVLLLMHISLQSARLWHHAARPERPPPAHAPHLSLAALLDDFDVRSPLFRQTLLRAIGAGGTAALAWKLGVPYPQWAPITVIVCVRPEKETSVLAALQNIIGTVLACVLTMS